MAAASASITKDKGPLHVKLLNAIKVKDIVAVRTLIDKGVDINHEEYVSTTPLLTCLKYYDPKIFELLLENGADPDFVYLPKIKHPLFIAVLNNNLDAVQKLVKYGAKVNQSFSEMGKLASSPLSQAVANINYEMVKFLVENGANVNFANRPENYSNNESNGSNYSNYEYDGSNNSNSESAHDNNNGSRNESGSESENEYTNVWGLSNAVPSKPHYPFRTALERAVMASETVSSKAKMDEIQKIILYLLEHGATYRESLGDLRKLTTMAPGHSSHLIPTLKTISRKAAFNRRKHLLATFNSKNTRHFRRQSKHTQTRRRR